MPDVVRVVTQKKGFGSRLADSIKGIFFGFILFLGAFPLLWWGEGRQNLAEFVQQATAAEPTGTPQIKESPLIKVTGAVSSDQSVIDPQFLTGTTGENILQLERNAEMYAWDEEVKTEEQGDNEVKTYTYTKKWTSWPDDSSNFNTPFGHENPPMAVKDESFKVQTAQVGELSFDAKSATFYKGEPLMFKKEQVVSTYQGRPTELGGGGKYLYLPAAGSLPAAVVPPPSPPPVRYDPVTGQPIYATPPPPPAPVADRKAESNPQVGDMRISYAHYPSGKTGTVVGDWDGNWIAPHVYRKTGTFLGVYPGSAEMFAAYLESQHRMITWAIRIGSFLMMWIGMNMILGPILLVMEKIPILGAVGRGMIGIVTGVIAFVLWLATLILANLWLVLLVMAALIIIAVIVAKKRKGQVAEAPAA